MPSDEKKKIAPARDKTDESLRDERKNTDRALSERREAAERDADVVVKHARENADAVLETARGKADDRIAHAGPASSAAVAEERSREDKALREERALADEALRLERADDARALLTLLPLEREKTDRHLLTERSRSDDAVSNRDDFLGIAAHDLRNLLGGIVMSAAHIAKSVPQGEAGKPAVHGAQRIQRYAARMNRLIGDLVDVASIDAGRLAVTLARGDATAVSVEAVEMFLGSAHAKHITLTTRTRESIMAAFDHDRLIQVLANLITNAIKFTPEGGAVEVSVERGKGEVQFHVTDDGPGIPRNKLEVIFQRFWQADTNDRRGVGLGLYISRCLVEAHGGKIWAESEEGHGSTVSFTIPDARPLPQASTS